MKRTALVVALLVMVLSGVALVSPAGGSAAPFPTLTTGAKGPKVCAARWLLTGHRPSVYKGIRTFTGPLGSSTWCEYGKRMVRATREAKRQLGFPPAAINGRFGNDLFQILTGRRARPLGYIARAAKIAAAEDARRREAARQTYAARTIQIAQGELGCREVPWGSNYSWCIAKYQAVTRAWRAAWCVSFLQWVYLHSGVGTFADRSASVFYVRDWMRARGWLRAVPKPAYLVMFLDRLGHIGMVERTTSSGFYSIEGNASNQVLRRFHPYVNERPKVYGVLPGLDLKVPA